MPPGCQHILQAGREMTPPVIVWRGDHMLPDHQQGIVVLGTPLGHEEFVKSQLRCELQEHSFLLQRIEAVPDLQYAWLILILCCCRANYFLRVVHSGSSEEFARQHDAAIWQVFLQLLNISGGQETRDLASLPCRHGGLGLRSEQLTGPVGPTLSQ